MAIALPAQPWLCWYGYGIINLAVAFLAWLSSIPLGTGKLLSTFALRRAEVAQVCGC